MEAIDLFGLERRLKTEVQVGERLDRRQPGGAHGSLQAAVVPQRDLGSEQGRECLRGAELPRRRCAREPLRGLRARRAP
jgi:hypothetical protein